ncbi:MAG TPA: hypothetical protein DDW52_01690 [Planctomycetaceae bacterium]|nr:hypothetical protein [Planctomycetaceae bacterium]
MQITFSTDMKCGSCVAKAQQIAERLDGVNFISASADAPHKPLTVDVADTECIESLTEKLAGAGIHLVDGARSMTNTAPPTPSVPPLVSIGEHPERATSSDSAKRNLADRKAFDITRYKPLALVVAYVAGATLVSMWLGELTAASDAMRLFMGYFFLGFAFFKLLDIPKFADAFATYDPIAARWRTYGLAYPLLEVVLGGMLITGTLSWVAQLIAVVVLSVGLVGVIHAVRRGQAIQCACLGTVFDLPMSSVTIVENTIMIVMGLAALTRIAF